jgi:polar amino acid transport system substrate-binding protein
MNCGLKRFIPPIKKPMSFLRRLNIRFSILSLYLVLTCCTTSVAADTLRLAIIGIDEGSSGLQIVKNIATEAGRRAGVVIEVVALPGKRAEQLLSVGTLDGDWARVEGFASTLGLIRVSEPSSVQSYIAYAKRSDIEIDGWKSLAPYRVTYIRGWQAIRNHLFPFHKNLLAVNTPSSGLKMVAAGRADLYVGIPLVVDPILADSSLGLSDVVGLDTPIDQLSTYIYLLPKHAQWSPLISDSLKTMKRDGSYDHLLSGGDPKVLGPAQ